jgi:hypothetical protein
LAVALMAAGAWAQAPGSWEAAFDGANAELLQSRGLTVLVAGVGRPEAEVQAAAEGLRASLRRRAAAALVLDDAALGTLTGESDEAVQRRAAGLPWDRILLVRVYPGVQEAPPSAVVVIASRSGTLGSVVVPRTARPPVPAPVAATAPPPLPPPPLTESPTPQPPSADQQAYDARRLHFGSLKSNDPAVLMSRGAFVGNRRIEGRALYELLKDTDFVARWDARARLKLIIGIAGAGVIALGGVGALLTQVSRCTRKIQSSSNACVQREVPSDLLVPSLVTAGVGLVTVLVAIILPADPVDPAEVVPAVDRYNQALKREVGLRVQVTPSLSTDGAGLLLVGRF